MNNQVKLIETIQRKIDELPPFNLIRYEQGKKDAYEEVIAMLIDTPPVPTIKPGDKVRYVGWQFREVDTATVDHLKVHALATYAKIDHEGETYTVPIEHLEVMK